MGLEHAFSEHREGCGPMPACQNCRHWVEPSPLTKVGDRLYGFGTCDRVDVDARPGSKVSIDHGFPTGRRAIFRSEPSHVCGLWMAKASCDGSEWAERFDA